MKKPRQKTRLWLAVPIFLLLVGAVVGFGRYTVQADWRTASREPLGIAPDPATHRPAVVQFYVARAFSWRGFFGVHSWIAVKPTDGLNYTVYEVIGWMAHHGGSPLVIHAGIHYVEGSLRARLCVAGKKTLYDYLQSHGVPFRGCGKLVVATREDEVPLLDAIEAKAKANGVDDLTRLSADQVSDIEPAVECAGALLSPSTGILDSHAFMLALQGEAEKMAAINAAYDVIEKERGLK